MFYLSYRPGPPLNEFVGNLWLIEGGQTPRLEKILPCGSFELVVNLKHNEMHIHDAEQPERYRKFSGAMVSGTYSRPFICDAMQHEAIMGVHFKLGGAFPFLNAEASELTNAHVNLADLWGRDGLELRERLCTVSTPRQRFRIMENALRARLDHTIENHVQLKFALERFGNGGKGFRSEMLRASYLSHQGDLSRCLIRMSGSILSCSVEYCDFKRRVFWQNSLRRRIGQP